MTTAAPYRYPPLLEVTPTDHTAWIAIATVLGLCCALVTALLRIFVRILISPPFGSDDTIVLVATAFATVQSAIMLYAVSMGLGRAEHLVLSADRQPLQQAAYAGDILYLVTVYLSKSSVIVLLLRLTKNRQHRIAFNATLVGTLVLCIASIFAISLRCDLSHPWLIFHEKCTGLVRQWQAVTAFDILTEAVIFGMSVYLLHGLHMSLRVKSIIVGVFAFRLVIIPFLIIRLTSFPRHHLSTDPFFTLTYFYIWTQSTLYLSLMVSTMPCFKSLVAGLNTGYGAFDTQHVATHIYASSYASNVNHDNGNHPQQRKNKHSRINWGNTMASRKSTLHSKVDNGPNSSVSGAAGHVFGPQRPTVDDESGIGNASTSRHIHHVQPSQMNAGVGLDLRVNAGQEGYTTSAVAQDTNSIGSNDSRQMIIRKDVTWAVEYSDPSA
ncbi:MAG: hypothetical protein Q9181_005537 [Wetmoreana brouardii]